MSEGKKVILRKDPSFEALGTEFGLLEVFYPEKDKWDIEAFEDLKKKEIEALHDEFSDYDRKAVFGDNPYYRYFKKFKKTYPILLQLESVLLKGRPFPSGNPINEVAFLTELRRQTLLGTHDMERVEGDIVLFSATEKTPFTGMKGEECHVYPKDTSGRDDRGIILSMIAGADDRTYIHPDSRHVAYLVFATPQHTAEDLKEDADHIRKYIEVLAPDAQMSFMLA